VQLVKKEVERGNLGAIYHARAFWMRRSGIPGLGTWFTSKQMAGGGPLIDLGIHVLDMALWVLGNPSACRVSAATYAALGPKGVFDEAPASLHRFKEGSYKQRQFRKGNLQVSFATGTPDAPNDRARVSVDADIDIYRSSVRHLFGEVLINHLTGSKTDQFRVWDTLASASVVPVAGFDVISA